LGAIVWVRAVVFAHGDSNPADVLVRFPNRDTAWVREWVASPLHCDCLWCIGETTAAGDCACHFCLHRASNEAMER